ncbi:MAG: hypothetical protein ABEJ43_06660 [Haloferacaceae archaeon]
MDTALRRRLDALIALVGLAVALLGGIAAATNPASLAPVLLWLLGVAVVYVVRPQWNATGPD